jgi:hypothetical protein
MNQHDLLVWVGSAPHNTLAREIFAFPFETLSAEIATPLCALMSKYGSDKGSGWHNYTKLYHHLLDKHRTSVRHVFEIGLGTNNLDVNSNMGSSGKPGASLRGWRDYFPNCLISGADIDRRILFEDSRIKTHYCDQTNTKDIAALWESSRDIRYDLMIDDGLHEFSANKTFLENSLHMLSDSGIFVIEDVVVSDSNLRNFQDLLRSMPVQSVLVKIPSNMNQTDNCLAIIRKAVR